MKAATYPAQVERWGVFEAACPGNTCGNPFTDYTIRGEFSHKNETVQAEGFYDGDGVYRVRFMPSFEGEYTFAVSGSYSDEPVSGSFTVTAPGAGNHGPVRVAGTYHFAYEDGTPYYSVGTTCYVWELQSESLQRKTLESLRSSAFNKIRFCLFPKHYDYNLNEPRSYPYQGAPMDSAVLNKENFLEYNGNPPGNEWDFSRFNTEHFQHIDRCIAALRDIGVEADLIVMHPYDRWGFSLMDREGDDRYWNYVVARYAAYRNVWWSLANEYDLMPQKSLADWERYAAILCAKDPYNHLRSIHNCQPFYDYTRPWITHCSIQRQDTYKSAELVEEWRIRYRKPVVLDEICYEGDIQHGWGNISGRELVRRFWEATCRGGYAGHGETFLHPEDILWWSHGGELHGESPERLRFLHRVLAQAPGHGLMPCRGNWDEVCATVEDTQNQNSPVKPYYLYYYGFNRPAFRDFYFDDDTPFRVEVLDTWEMTVADRGVCSGKFRVDLPGKEYMAIRLTKV